MRKPDIARILRGAASAISATGRLIRLGMPRAYALGLILLIGWLTFRSVRYLVNSLVKPTEAPAQITDLPTRLNLAFLETNRASWRGLSAAEHPRTPPAHYHRVDTWIHPDRFNDCTRSGCHGPMPHFRRKEVRAFLNMHATSIHCGVCHFESDQTVQLLVWYDLDDGRPRRPPSILDALDLLTSEKTAARRSAPDEALRDRIKSLLISAADEADGAPALAKLAEHFAAVSLTSSAFQQLLVSAREELPRHFHGEYGAKLAVKNRPTGNPILGHPGSEAAVREFLESSAKPSDEKKNELLERVHTLRRSTPVRCQECHRREGGFIEFSAVGFPAARVEELVDPVVVGMIEHIAEGRGFQMPTFIAPDGSNEELSGGG